MLLAAVVCGGLAAAQTPHVALDPELEAHIAAAQDAQRRQDYATAEREYKTVLLKVPGFAEMHMNLGLVYQLQGRIPDAMAAFREALGYKPGLGGANFMLGVDYCEQGDGHRAIPYLTAAARDQAPRHEVWSWLATAQEMTGAVQAELTTLNRGLQRAPGDIDLLYLRGHAYERLGQAEVAHMQTTGADAYRTEELLAQSYAMSSEWPTAVLHFQRAIAISADRRGPHVELGEVLLRANKRKQAVEEFDRELSISPHSVRALVRRGEARLLDGELESSLADWTQALATDALYTQRILGLPSNAADSGDAAFEQLPDEYLQQLAGLVPQLQQRSGSAAALALHYISIQRGESHGKTMDAAAVKTPGGRCNDQAALQAFAAGNLSRVAGCAPSVLTPASTQTMRIQVAEAQFEMGEYQKALSTLAASASAERPSNEKAYWRARCFERLSTLAYVDLYRQDPNSYRLHQLLGDLSEAMGDDSKAVEEYRAAIALRPTAPNLHYSLGHTLWKNSDVPGARAELEAELAMHPGHAGTLHDLGDTYLLEHQPEKALSYLTRASAAGESGAGLHKDLGTAYAELGDQRRAEAEFLLAVPEDRDGSVHFKLGRTYLALGKKDLAAKEFAASGRLNREQHAKREEETPKRIEIERQ